MSLLGRRYLWSRPGERHWGEFCEFVLAFLYLERGSGYVCYRPRDASYFSWAEDPAREAEIWNASQAGRPVMITVGRKRGGFVTLDGCRVCWRAAKAALGVIGGDMNMALPNPDHMTDAHIVDVYGLDYALWRVRRRKIIADRAAAAFDKAVLKYEARIGRALAAHEKDIARSACKMVD
jgi:hypothetical protein